MPPRKRRSSELDLATVRDFREQLSRFDDSGESRLSVLLPNIAGFMGAERAAVMGIEVSEFGYAAGNVYECGFGTGARFASDLASQFVGGRNPYSLYNPVRPEPWQRNRVLSPVTRYDDRLHLEAAGRMISPPKSVPLARELRRRFDVRRQVRSLVCDGPVLLAWVGTFYEAAPTIDAERRLSMMLPMIRRRLKMERLLAAASLYATALSVILENISSPAFIVSASGLIKHANAPARVLLEREPSLRNELAAATKHEAPSGRFTISRFSPKGIPEHHLVICALDGGDGALRLQRLRARWSLTARQTEVLGLVADGHPNKTIAALLDCAENTVEFHVTALLDRAGVENRAALVARFWTTPLG